jgi:hypothetical protein
VNAPLDLDLRALVARAVAAKGLVAAADPVVWARRRGWEPDEIQKRVLRSKADRVMLLCTRQFGKSTVAACVAAWTAYTRPGSMILLVSPSQRQSLELFAKVKRFARGAKLLKNGAFEWHLANGSRIAAVPGTEETIRSFSAVDLLIEDEASRVPDELYMSVRPMLAVSRGRLFLLTTPFGQRGHFYKEWTGEARWDRYEVKASDCDRIGTEFLAEEREALGEAWFEQEYCCRFLATDDALFSDEEIARAFEAETRVLDTERDAVRPLFGGRS